MGLIINNGGILSTFESVKKLVMINTISKPKCIISDD